MKELESIDKISLKEKIIELNESQLKKVSKIAKDFFVLEFLDLKKLEMDNFLINELDDTIEKKRLLEIYNSLEYIFIKFIDEDIFNKEELLELRREIYEYSEVLSAYYIELKYLKDKLDQLIIIDRENKLEIAGKLESRRRTIIDNIEVEARGLQKNIQEYINFMATIVNILPFKLSKYKYFDLIEKTLRFNLSEFPQEYALIEINNYKKQLSPYLYKGYGINFNDYFRDIELFKRESLEGKSIKDLESFRNDIEKYLDSIGYNILNIRRIGILTNRILTVAMISEEYNIKYDDKMEELFKEDSIKISEKIKSEYKIDEKELFKIVDDFKLYNDEMYRRGEKDIELDKIFDKARELLIYYNDIDFSDDRILNMKEEDTAIDKEILDKIIDNFIDFIKRNIKDLEIMDSRIRMRSLLTIFTPPFISFNEFMDYVKYSLDRRIITDKELNLVLISLNYLINSRQKMN